MKMKIRISEEEHEKILALKKRNKNKRVDKKLEVLSLRYEGKSNAEISKRTGYNERYITKLMGDYAKQGLEEFIRIKQTSHNWHLSEKEEARILEEVEQRAEEGTVLTVADIEAVFREKMGGYIFQDVCIPGIETAWMAKDPAAIQTSKVSEQRGTGSL